MSEINSQEIKVSIKENIKRDSSITNKYNMNVSNLSPIISPNISPNISPKREEINSKSKSNSPYINQQMNQSPINNIKSNPMYLANLANPVINQQANPNPIQESDKQIFTINKQKNIEKLFFFEFMTDITKIEFYLEKLQGYLFWQGFLEYFVWLILLSFFISSPRTMTTIWVFFYHIARATIGLCILKFIPKSYQVIENLRDYEDLSIEDIQIRMENSYMNLIRDCEKILKPLLTLYFVLTIISMILDVIVFGYIAVHYKDRGMEHREFALLLGVVTFIICDFVYFSFFFSLRYSFSPEFLAPVRLAVMGFFKDLKDGVKSGVSKVFKRFKRRITTSVSNRW